MRIFVAIPHFFDNGLGGPHASERSPAEARAAIVRLCLASLVQHFSPAQALVNSYWQCFHPVNADLSPGVTIALCTTGDSHLVPQLGDGGFEHVRTAPAAPYFLGFECHKILREHLGQYDYYVYLEDDLRLADGLFFAKLAWFTGLFGEAAILQPNRFELMVTPAPYKLYCDGNVIDPSKVEGLQQLDEEPRLEADALGRRVAFQRVGNPHSGCFFMTAAQLARWAAQPDFGVPSRQFWGPLESAATFGVARHFRAYKPARENADFLEIEHLEPGLLGTVFAPIPGEPGSLRPL